MKDKSKILIIKSFRDEFENYFNYQMREEGINVWNENIIDKELNKNFLIRQLQICYRIVKSRWISNIRQYDNIIIFDAIRLIPWIVLLKRRKSRIILWKWNIALPKSVWKIKLLYRFCEVWTFDINDTELYQWKLNHQFYFYPQIKNDIDPLQHKKTAEIVFFVGKDKGRYLLLKEIFQILNQQEIQCDFYLVKDENGQYETGSEKWLRENGMLYSQVIDHIIQCDAVLELVQEGQRGFTLRVLEALFYHKKLITNNMDIIYSNIYSADNIFVIGYDNWNNLRMFLQSPYQDLPEQTLDLYTFDNWLKRFE